MHAEHAELISQLRQELAEKLSDAAKDRERIAQLTEEVKEYESLANRQSEIMEHAQRLLVEQQQIIEKLRKSLSDCEATMRNWIEAAP